MALEKITGIVTNVTKHSDRHNVITIFTREKGRVSLLTSAGTGKTSKLRNASLMPMTVISADINFNSNRELLFLGSFSRPFLWKDIYFNPAKTAVTLFLAEFINSYIRQSAPDPGLWDYIVGAMRHLDSQKRGIANFHIAFLLDFLYYAGIRPDLSEWRRDAWFDMQGGTMTIFPPAHRNYLSPGQTEFLPVLSRMNLRTAPLFRFSGEQRRRLLNGLLHYYSLHFPGMANLKSPAVLSEVFS